MFRKNKLLPLAAVGFIGVIVVILSTSRYGIGINTDSVHYICASRSLLNGLGLSEPVPGNKLIPLTHFPPLFPVLLYIIGLLGLDPSVGARFLNAFLFGANILLIGFAVNNYTRSLRAAMFASLLTLVSGGMLSLHTVAWSEPLFIFFAFSGLFLLSSYIENPKPLFFAASLAAVVLASFTRYVGITLFIAGAMGIFFLSRKSRLKRIAEAMAFGVISSIPVMFWFLRNFYFTGGLTDRRVILHPLGQANFGQALHTFSFWFLFAVVAGISGLGIFLLNKKRGPHKNEIIKQPFMEMPYLLAIFILIYVISLLVSISFFDASTPLDFRILSPVYISGLIIILCLGYKLLYSQKSAFILKMACVLTCVAFFAYCMSYGILWVKNIYSNGEGYNSKSWRQSEIIQRIRRLSPAITIYTNGPDAIYFLTGRIAYLIPCKTFPIDRKANDAYASEMAKMQKRLREKKAVLVYLNNIRWRWYIPSESEINKQFPFLITIKSADGVIYKGN